MMMMVLIEATVLLRTFSRSYDRIEDLSKSLEASNEDLRETNRAVIRFVPFDFLRLLKKDSIREVKRGDCIEADMSIMFCDIRGFTTLIESHRTQREDHPGGRAHDTRGGSVGLSSRRGGVDEPG